MIEEENEEEREEGGKRRRSPILSRADLCIINPEKPATTPQRLIHYSATDGLFTLNASSAGKKRIIRLPQTDDAFPRTLSAQTTKTFCKTTKVFR